MREPSIRTRSSYLHILNELGLPFSLNGPWAAVGRSSRIQGWKLHLSSIPSEAERLLREVLPIVLAHGISFKIAQDAKTLHLLNEGELGTTQVGKFMTIYPQSDEQARRLADELTQTSRDFHGPVVMTDLRLGEVVYARYGGFNPLVVRDRLGQLSLHIYDTGGTLRPDAYQVPFTLPSGIANPFGASGLPMTGAEAELDRIEGQPRSRMIFGPGYLLLEAIRSQAKGSVFRALDLRSQEQVSAKIIKQGRQFCLSDEYGRDVRARLRRQEQLHQSLCGKIRIPRADAYFEVNGNGYLPLEQIDGRSIEQLTASTLQGRPWQAIPVSRQGELIGSLRKLALALQKMHGLGYIHRDVSASNVWIGTDGEVYLLDLELTHAVDDPTPPFALGTPGFMSPQQERLERPAFSDDVYSFGCVTALVLTGLDPRRIPFWGQGDEAGQIDRLLRLAHLPTEIVRLLVKCVRSRRRGRPKLEEILTVLEEQETALGRRNQGASQSSKVARKDISDLVAGGQRGLVTAAAADSDTGLWLSASLNARSHAEGGRLQNSYELRRSANRGVAGVVYLLSRLARFQRASDEARKRAQTAVQWLLREQETPDAGMPGLHFGEAGVAVSLAEAVAAQWLERDEKLDAFLRRTLSSPPDWPDVTHGAAGQGLAALACADRLRDPRLLEPSHLCAQYLIETQQDDGSWRMPAGVEGMSDEILTGFAHGVAGIVYFLAEHAHRFGDTGADMACRAGADWLLRQAIPGEAGRVLEWPYGMTRPERWKWWCHGSPGIALTFLKLHELTGDPLYAQTAAKAALIHPPNFRHPNLSQCHGLAGLGEIYLEAWRVLREDCWLDRAWQIAEVLYAFRRESEHRAVTWLVEDSRFVTADLMVGTGGIVHFLLRLLLEGEGAGLPLLPDPPSARKVTANSE